MNTAKTLFTVLSTLIFLIVIAITVGVLLTILSATGVISSDIKFRGVIQEGLGTAHFIFMGLNLIFYFVFVYGLVKLRLLAKRFMEDTFYHTDLGRHSSLAGKSFVLVGIFWWLIDGMSSIHFDHTISIGVSDKTFIYLFITAVGMFLMLISKLMDEALMLKNESELTI